MFLVLLSYVCTLTHAELRFEAQPQSVTSTQTTAGSILPDITVQFYAIGSPDPSKTDTISLSLIGGDGLLGTSFKSASSGLATFSGLTINQLCSSCTLVATSQNENPIESDPFNITAGSEVGVLQFTVQPTDKAAGETFAVQVTMKDAAGIQTVGGNGKKVFLTIVGDGVLDGGGEGSSVAGVVDYSNLQVDGYGTFLLKATYGSVQVYSNPFTVAPGMTISLPSSPNVGQDFTITVVLKDASGTNLSTSQNVTIAKASGPGTLLGASGVTSSDGNFVFTSLKITKAGSYTFLATCTDCTAVKESATLQVANPILVQIDPPQTYLEISTTLTYTIQLLYTPIDTVNITFDYDSTQVSLNTSSLSFTTANIPQNVIVTPTGSGKVYEAQIGHNAEYASNASIEILFQGCDEKISEDGVLSLVVFDVAATGEYVYFEGVPKLVNGGTGQYVVKLSTAPSSAVTVQPSGTELSFNPNFSVLNFINWNSGATITVTYTGSAPSGTKEVDIKHIVTSSDSNFNNPTVLPETYKAVILQQTTAQVYISEDVILREGLTGSYFIVLTRMPSSNVTIELTITDPTLIEFVKPTSGILTFTPSTYNQEQEIIVQATVVTSNRSQSNSTTITHVIKSGDSVYNGITATPSSTVTVTLKDFCPSGYNRFPAGSLTCLPCEHNNTCDNTQAPQTLAAGTFSILGANDSVTCLTGTHCDGKSAALPCGMAEITNGTSCDTCTGNCWMWGLYEIDCPTSTYQSGNGRMCQLCPAGFSCAGDNSLTECSAGQYSPLGENTCKTCPQGFYCPDPSFQYPIPCPPGTFAAAGAESCTVCAAGKECTNIAETGNCAAGSSSLGGISLCTSCETDCSSSLDICPPGQEYTSSCQDCAQGNFCTSYWKGQCFPGFFQDTPGSIYCKKCPKGQYQTLYAQSACVDAPAGEFLIGSGVKSMKCPPGTTSTANQYSCAPCPIGMLCADPADPTDACPAGSVCHPFPLFTVLHEHDFPCPYGKKCAASTSVYSDISNCPAQKACNKGTTDTGEVDCAPGHFCPANTLYPTQRWCLPGTYSTSTTNQLASDCTAADPGSYIPLGGPNQVTCPVGNYCAGGEAYPTPCAAGEFQPNTGETANTACSPCTLGFYCPQETFRELQCPHGYFGPSANLTQLWDCSLCTAGKYCNAVQLQAVDGDCPEGYYCPLGTSNGHEFPCPAGKDAGTDTGYTSSADCATSCPAGFYCAMGTNDVTQAKIPCPAGTKCQGGEKWAFENRCNGGTYQNQIGQTSCSACAAGTWCYPGAFYYHQLCAPGFYCEANQERPDINPCNSGKYSNSGTLTANSECDDCPLGHYCPPGSFEPIICPPGYFTSASAEVCTECTQGNYCPKGSESLSQCLSGTFAPAGLSECYLCREGYYCGPNAGSETQCADGTYCTEGSDQEYTCPDGFRCIQGIKIACEPGTIPNAADDACENITAGDYTLAQRNSTDGKCNPGYYCPAGSRGPFQKPCPRGKYRATQGAGADSDCADCPAGFYCPTGTDIPIICDVGSYCDGGDSLPIPCPIGTTGPTYGLKAESECVKCAKGRVCMETGSVAPITFCTQGFECAEGSSTSVPVAGVCSAGGYCEQGLNTKRDCPPGTFNPDTGAKDSSWCKPCTEGYFCEGIESSLGDANKCLAGYYCPQGAWWDKQEVASPGTYTTTGAYQETQCAKQTYNPLYAQPQCKTCIAGYYCPDLGMSYPFRCGKGYYCPADSETQLPCQQGSFMSKEGTSDSDCYPCPPGMYCSRNQLEAPEDFCDPGYYCMLSSITNSPATGSGVGVGQCPEGNYCPVGTSYPVPCPAGTFHNKPGQTDESSCADCTEGYYCEDWGQTAVDTINHKCSPGYYCRRGERVAKPNPITVGTPELKFCQAGEKCPEGSSEPTDCPAGTYQPHPYQADCLDCPTGFYCPTRTTHYTDNPCPKGYYCPPNTQFAKQYPCPSGRYNPHLYGKTVNDCLPCPPGKYCTELGRESPEGDCDPGYFCKLGSQLKNPQTSYPGNDQGGKCIKGQYCPLGSALPKACDAEMYCDEDGLAAPKGYCDAGYYCLTGATSPRPTTAATGGGCPAGHYCPQTFAGDGVTVIGASKVPIPCPPGKYSASTLNKTADNCLSCPPGYYCSSPTQLGMTNFGQKCAAGYYCVGGNIVPRPAAGQCQAGYKCKEGSSDQRPCPPGEYQNLTLQSTCKTCPAGYYCENQATSDPALCPKGKYCISGTDTPRNCPVGTYNPLLGRTKLTDCIDCPPGKYCEGEANEVPDGDCAAGYYCTRRAEKAQPDSDAQGGRCNKGTICPIGSSSPKKCPPGFYCDADGMESTDKKCAQGYYCIEGATSATPRDGITGDICSAGHYCGENSSYQTPCPIGTYNRAMGKALLADCIQCQKGSYCGNLGATNVSGPCAAGYYCPSGMKTDKPEGNLCSAGHYCPQGSYEEKQCPQGRYQNKIGQSTCDRCPAGYKCDVGAIKPVECDAGYRCPLGTSTATRIPCEYGEYQPFTGQSQCWKCPPGTYCGAGPVTEPVVCEAEKYCPEGTSSPPPLCPSGTANTFTGLHDKEQCFFCESGRFCINGKLQTDKCAAGYLCESGVNTLEPNGYSNTGVGSLCPEGHYCLEGTALPTPCPEGKVRKAQGGKEEADCTDCSAGYYCIKNDPIPKQCMPGDYCPEGSSEPLHCPEGTYSLTFLASSPSSCKQCPKGYLCDNSGIGNYENYPCQPGFYCLAGYTVKYPSIRGTYSPTNNMGAISELILCPGGYYCPEGSTGYVPCEVGEFCPAGQDSEKVCEGQVCSNIVDEPKECPAGSYCNNLTATPAICLAGWYCPSENNLTSKEVSYEVEEEIEIEDEQGETQTQTVTKTITLIVVEYPPIKCPEGAICVQGSSAPRYCQLGEIAVKARYIYSSEPQCVSCPKGTYAHENHVTCETCPAGYVCLGHTTSPNPTSIDTENGYECIPGFYCPEGSYQPTPCPAGTFSTEVKMVSEDSCELCGDKQYSYAIGATSCQDCGQWANSSPDRTSCQCIGDNRSYLQTDQSCICMTGYEYINESGDEESKVSRDDDCSKQVYDRCQENEVRDEDGDCRKKDEGCSDKCQQGSDEIDNSEREPGTGMCLCENVDELNYICNASCRQNAVSTCLSVYGNLQIVDPEVSATEVTTKALSDIGGVSGTPVCYTSSCCDVVSVSVGTNLKGLYGAPASVYTRPVTEETARRVQDEVTVTETPGISDPVICIDVGDTLLFNIDFPTSYPVYNADSLINSNPKFDYSLFTKLASDIQAESEKPEAQQNKIEIFMYTFLEPGTYLFENSSNPDSQMIIGVMSETQTCPFGGANIQPRTLSSLHLIGTKQETELVLVVDWVVVGTLMGLLMLVILIFTALFYYYTKLAWHLPPPATVGYREEQKKFHIKPDKEHRATMFLYLAGEEADAVEEQQIRKLMFDKQPDVIDIEPEVVDDEHDQQEDIMRQIRAKLQDNHQSVTKALKEAAAESEERLHKLVDETNNLRDLVIELLEPLAAMGRGEYYEEDDFNLEDQQSGIGTTSGVPDIAYQQGVDEIANNTQLIETDKQLLMDELTSQLKKIDENTSADKTKHDQQLQDRIAARNAKRKELALRKKQIESELNNFEKNLENDRGQILTWYQEQEQLIDQEFQQEKDEIRAEIGGSEVQFLQESVKQAIEADPSRRQEFLDQYERELADLQANLNSNQQKQQQELMRRLEEKRRRRRKDLQESRQDQEKQLEQQHYEKQQSLIRQKEELEMLEAIDQIVPQYDDSQSKEEDKNRIRDLELAHKEQQEQLEEEMREEEEQQVGNLYRRASMNNQSMNQQKQEYLKRKAELEEAIADSQGFEKEELMRQMQSVDENLVALTTKQNKEQKKNLDARLQMRREQRAKKLADLQQKQTEEKRKLEEEIARKNKQEENARLEVALQSIIQQLPRADMKDQAIRSLLEEKHDKELADLKRKLRIRLRDSQKDVVQRVLREKARDLEYLRQDFKERLRNAVNKEDEEEVARQEQEALSRLDFHYNQQFESAQEEAWKRQQKENQDELLKLIDQQLAETRRLLASYNIEDTNNEMESSLLANRSTVEREGQQKINELEDRRRKLEEEKQKKQQELEELIRKEQEEQLRQQYRSQLMEQRKALLEKQKKQREELERRGQLTQEQMERLIAMHQKELERADRILNRERERQMAILSHKLAEKRRKRKEYEEHKAKYKEDQDRIQKALDNLPSLGNKQAASLLTKWRRYPKKNLQDYEDHLRNMPPVMKENPKSQPEGEYRDMPVDKKMMDLIKRIERIEKVAVEIDTEKFGALTKVFNEISDKLSKQ